MPCSMTFILALVIGERFACDKTLYPQGPRVVPHTHGRGDIVPQPCGLVTYNPITNYGTKSSVYIATTFLIVTVTSKLFIRRMSGIEYGWYALRLWIAKQMLMYLNLSACGCQSS